VTAATVFTVPAPGGTPTVLATFNRTNGAAPTSRLTISGSTLYETTVAGGASGLGTVFALTIPSPSAAALFGLGGLIAGRRRRN